MPTRGSERGRICSWNQRNEGRRLEKNNLFIITRRRYSDARHHTGSVRPNDATKSHPKVGALGEKKFVVEAKHAIDFADGGMPPVLCTPWLIWFLEHTARDAVLPWLEPGESTVGLEIELRHVAPTPLSHTVTCTARVIHVEGARITFQVEAHDETELIARGVHRLHIIRVAGFAKRVELKRAGH